MYTRHYIQICPVHIHSVHVVRATNTNKAATWPMCIRCLWRCAAMLNADYTSIDTHSWWTSILSYMYRTYHMFPTVAVIRLAEICERSEGQHTRQRLATTTATTTKPKQMCLLHTPIARIYPSLSIAACVLVSPHDIVECSFNHAISHRSRITFDSLYYKRTTAKCLSNNKFNSSIVFG